jgi:prepilin-type N-terminal cleavage/methylation domain-containing protein
MQERDQKGLSTREAGFTVMEIMIVIAVVAMVTAGVILGFSSLSRSKLRSTAYLLAAAAQRAYSYSTTRNESVRLVLELDEGVVLLESTEKRVLIGIRRGRRGGGGGENLPVAGGRGAGRLPGRIRPGRPGSVR